VSMVTRDNHEIKLFTTLLDVVNNVFQQLKGGNPFQ